MAKSEIHDSNTALLHVATPDEFFPQASSWSRLTLLLVD